MFQVQKHNWHKSPLSAKINRRTLAASVAQPQTYQSKERTATTGDYDFGPRRYISAAPFWRAPDPKAHDYPNISPYTFCAANPIRYADPTGMVFTEAAQKYADQLQSYAISAFMDALRNQRFDLADKFNATLVEIKKMAESEVVFDAREWDKENLAKTTYHVGTGEKDTDAVLFTFPKNALKGIVAHEFKHGYQFLTGDMDLATDNRKYFRYPILADYFDEGEAYQRSYLFGDALTTFSDIKKNDKYNGKIHPIKKTIENIMNGQKKLILQNNHDRAVYINKKVYYQR